MVLNNVQYSDSGIVFISESASECIYEIDVGTYVAPAVLSSSGGQLVFSIPLYRRFGRGASVVSVSGNMTARAYDATTTGRYIVKNAASGTSAAAFNTANGTWMNFYDGANNHRTPTAKPTLTLHSGASILFNTGNQGTNYFTGSAANTTACNNNAVTLHLTGVKVRIRIPKIL